MTDQQPDGDAKRLAWLKTTHAEHTMPMHCSTCFLLAALDARDAALRGAKAENERLERLANAARALRDRHNELEAGEGDVLLAGMSLATLILAVNALDAAHKAAPERPREGHDHG